MIGIDEIKRYCDFRSNFKEFYQIKEYDELNFYDLDKIVESKKFWIYMYLNRFNNWFNQKFGWFFKNGNK